MKAPRKTRALILAVLTIFVMTLSVCLLSSCNQEYEGDKEYGVLVSRVEYDVYQDNPNFEDGVIYVFANPMTLTVTSGNSTVQTVTVDAGDAYKYSATANSNAGGWTKFYGPISAE